MSATKTGTGFDHRRVFKLVCIAWFISKIICYQLWFADRLFPLVPIHESLSAIPSFLHSTLFFISLASMLVFLFFPDKKIMILLLLAELLSCMLDQNRWQPWEYQFIFMLATMVFCKEEKQVLFAWQCIIAGLYFFGGLGKLNSAFIHDTWQHLVLHKWLGVSGVNISVTRSGYLLPLIEMAAGAGLLFHPAKKICLLILILMHGLILLMLGPLGLNINAVVWPWNLLMPFCLYFVFFKPAMVFSKTNFYKPFIWLVLLCWWVMPWLQLAGYWDKYLSAVLYSGGVEQLFICTQNPAAQKQMAPYLDSTFRVIPCDNSLSVYNWGIKDMKTAPYPEKRVFEAIIKAWKKRFPGTCDRFYLYKPGFSYSVKEVLAP